jgi:toxin ParE1/3/4
MSRYQITKPAKADLDDILTYIACDNPDAAARISERFTEVFRFLAQMPYAGIRRSFFPPDVRALTVRNYIVYYVPLEAHVKIVRVIHGNRQQESIRFH